MPPADVVFDMDGVLADTEGLKFRAHRSAAESLGGGLDRGTYREWIGGDHLSVVRAFLAASGLDTDDETVEAYETRFREAYRRLLETDLRPTEGTPELLAVCRREGRRLALVTSSERWMAEVVLEGLGARDAFRAVVTADDVEREKPDPEAYLKARAALAAATGSDGDGGRGAAREAGDRGRAGGDPEDGGARSPVAVEDTVSGVRAAVSAGLAVIAVRHDLNRGHDFGAAAAVVDSLAPAGAFLALADRVAAGA